MKIGSIFVGFLLGFATYFVILQCVTPSESHYFTQLCNKNIQIRNMEERIKELEDDLDALTRLNEGYNQTINKFIRGN